MSNNGQGTRTRVPRDPDEDYTVEAAAMRRAFLTEQTGRRTLEHRWISRLRGTVGG